MRRALLLLVPLALAAAAVTWVVQPNLIVGLRSPRALAWLAAAAAACLAVGLLARRLGAKPWLAVAAGALPGVIVAGLVVVRPVVSPRELTEALPSAASTPSATPSSPASTAASPAPPAAPARVASGELRGLAGHDARGRVATYRLADGTYAVRFEDVDIGGTPDPEVYLLPGRDRSGKAGGVHLGALKAERGSFNYVLPAGFAGTEFTVLVWCERFAVDIAHATQGPPATA